jgi:hypothetical protein
MVLLKSPPAAVFKKLLWLLLEWLRDLLLGPLEELLRADAITNTTTATVNNIKKPVISLLLGNST